MGLGFCAESWSARTNTGTPGDLGTPGGRGWESGPLQDPAVECLSSPSGTQRPPPGVNDLIFNLSIAPAKHRTTSKDPTQRPTPHLSSLWPCLKGRLGIKRLESATVRGPENPHPQGLLRELLPSLSWEF